MRLKLRKLQYLISIAQFPKVPGVHNIQSVGPVGDIITLLPIS